MSIPAINWCIEQSDLSPGEWVVLFHLCHAHNQEYGCFPSQDFLAEKTNMGRRTIVRHMNTLEERGRIKKTKRFNASGAPISSLYTFPFMPDFEPSANLTTGQTMHDQVPFDAQNMHEMAHKQEKHVKEQEESTPVSPSTELSLFPSKPAPKKKTVAADVISEVTDVLCEVVPISVAEDFIGHRKDMKKPMTVRSAKAIAKQLTGHPDPAAVLNASIANGWQGIFPDKFKPQNSNTGANYDRSQNANDPALSNIARLAGLSAPTGDGGS